MAIVDSDYKFIWASVGSPGSCSDGGIFKRCSLRRKIEDGRLNLPPADPLIGDNKDIPYFFVGDDAFGIAKWLMKPYPMRRLTPTERIYNYRFSRARRIVENGFGILANRWRCLLTTLGVSRNTAKSVVLACLTLHNVVRMRRPQLQPGEVDREDRDGNVVPGQWQEGVQLTDNSNLAGNRGMREAKAVRNHLKDYYNNPRWALRWQDRAVQINPLPQQGQDEDSEPETDSESEREPEEPAGQPEETDSE